MKPQETWVLVADGARARILRDVLSTGKTSREHEDLVFHRSGGNCANHGRQAGPQLRFNRNPPVGDGVSFRSGARKTVPLLQCWPICTAQPSSRRRFRPTRGRCSSQMLGDLRQAFPESLRKVTAAENSQGVHQAAGTRASGRHPEARNQARLRGWRVAIATVRRVTPLIMLLPPVRG